MLTLAKLKEVRQNKRLSPVQLSELTGITRKRLGQLENHSRDHAEPWFKEAVVLARVLNSPGINDLIGSQSKASGDLTYFFEGSDPLHLLRALSLGAPMPVDRDVFRSGLEMSLTVACRVAIEFGLADPYYLLFPPPELLHQIWATLASSERLRAPGSCPWCTADIVGGAAHLPTCLPNNLWSPRGREAAPNVSFTPAPRRAGGGHGSAAKARGLKRIRTERGMTQAEMGALFGASSDYYAKMERCALNLLMVRAEVIANSLGIDIAEIYRADDGVAPGAGA